MPPLTAVASPTVSLPTVTYTVWKGAALVTPATRVPPLTIVELPLTVTDGPPLAGGGTPLRRVAAVPSAETAVIRSCTWSDGRIVGDTGDSAPLSLHAATSSSRPTAGP